MDTLQAIAERRSIRKFARRAVSRADMDRILRAGIQAPSGKNQQPWKFVAVSEADRPAMLDAIQRGIDFVKQNPDAVPNSQYLVPGAEHTLRVMADAPVTVFVFHTEAADTYYFDAAADNRFLQAVNIQSIGAAIQNMILAATALGIGSLWICDVFLSLREIGAWLGEETQLVAAVSFGYADESPAARPRKAYDDVVVWR